MDWLKFYGLKGEPFGPQPLRRPNEFQDVFVLTDSIKVEVNPILSTIGESERYLYLIFGERGAGKSTLMHYIINELNDNGNILTVDISLIKKSYETPDPGYGLAIDLTSKIALKTIEAISNKYERIYNQNKALFDNYSDILIEKVQNLEKVGIILKKIFNILIKEKIFPVIFIDNLDKFNKDIVLNFLGFRYAQSLFEEFFFPFGARAFLVSVQSWHKELSHPDYSYLGEPINIRPLNFAETQTLIQKKMRKKALDIENFEFPFNEESIIYIGKISNGNPRKIQEKCRTSLIEGAKNEIKEINRDFLHSIENDLGNEFEIVRDLLIQYPNIERILAWLLEVRTRFNNSKSFENALIDIQNFQKGDELESQTKEKLRDYELILLSLEKLDEVPKYRVNPLIDNLFGKINNKMTIDNFIKWFSRTDADTISIPHTKTSVLEDFRRVFDALPTSKKNEASEILKNYDSFRQCYLEDDDRNECLRSAHSIAKNLISLVVPEILIINDLNKLEKVLAEKISNEVGIDFSILNAYFIKSENLNLSAHEIDAISERLNNIIESISNYFNKNIVKEIPYLFFDTISLANFMKKRTSNPGFLFISSETDNLSEHYCICWMAESAFYGLSITNEKENYFDDAFKFFADYYQFIPFPIQNLLNSHKISPIELEEKGTKFRVAHFYELAVILNRIVARNINIKLIFVDEKNLNLWTASFNHSNQKIQLTENETLKNIELSEWLDNHPVYDNKESKISKIEKEKPQLSNKEILHILHLSDIHLNSISDANQYRNQLETDLIKELKINKLDYVVISGDITNQSIQDEYNAAVVMIKGLIQRFKLDINNVIIIPGNHDLNWDISRKAYKFTDNPPNPLPIGHIKAGDVGVLLKDESLYRERFINFSNYLYKELFDTDYPLNYVDQAILYPNIKDKILFLGLNSCWEIDHHEPNQKRANINTDAFSRAIQQILDEKYDDWLKIAVWHHPVNGDEALVNSDFIEQLVVHGFQICMHGHIHEAIEMYSKYDEKRGIHIVGAGTFGAQIGDQNAGVPLQYNLLLYNPNNQEITIKTRKKEKVFGSWSADARWGDKNNPSPHYTIKLTK